MNTYIIDFITQLMFIKLLALAFSWLCEKQNIIRHSDVFELSSALRQSKTYMYG